MKVGIVTFYRPINNGAVLQACATNRILSRKLNISSELLDYRAPRTERYRKSWSLQRILHRKGATTKCKGLVADVLYYTRRRKEQKLYDSFLEKHLHISNTVYRDFTDLRRAEEQYDAFLVGSDLVWNPQMTEGVNPIYFLEFAPNKKKIAYAASVGMSEPPEELLKEIAAKAEKLDCISLREKTTAMQLQPYVKKKVHAVLDPTLLTDGEDWASFYDAKPLCDRKYIFAFCLEKSDLLVKQVNLLAKTYGYEIITSTRKDGFAADRVTSVRFQMGPSEFLNYVRHAQIVVTNSFHGCAFSVLFHKDLYCIPHTTRGVRMTELMMNLEMPERIIQETPRLCEKVDYEQVEKIRASMMQDSMTYLVNALKEDVR